MSLNTDDNDDEWKGAIDDAMLSPDKGSQVSQTLSPEKLALDSKKTVEKYQRFRKGVRTDHAHRSIVFRVAQAVDAQAPLKDSLNDDVFTKHNPLTGQASSSLYSTFKHHASMCLPFYGAVEALGNGADAD